MDLLLKAPEALMYLLTFAGACFVVALGLLIYTAAYVSRRDSDAHESRFLDLLSHPPKLFDELYIGPPGPGVPDAHTVLIRRWFELALKGFALALLVALPLLKVVRWVNRH